MKKLIRIMTFMFMCLMLSTSVKAEEIPAWTETEGIFYNDKGEVIEGAIAKGIDVSHHQGEIDWEKVSKTDIKFAIIRCGYGNDEKGQDDKYFSANIEGCKKYGIPYGIYIYSYATNIKMAQSEANHVLRLIKETSANPSYPIYLDMEDSTQYNVSNSTLADIAETFCNAMINAGYTTGVYAYTNWWNTKLTDMRFDLWNRWVAQYNSNCTYNGRYEMWQFTSTGTVDGIYGDTDLNILFLYDCDAKGHMYSTWTVTKNPTCISVGEQVRKCIYCEHSESTVIKEIAHNYKWKVILEPTVLKKGKQQKVCQKCGHIAATEKIAKLKPTGKLNKTKITLKVKKKYKKLKVKNLAKGDYVKKYKSSNSKIAKVNKKGVITAGKKKGTAKITVVLKSGKKLKLKVTVKK